MREIQPHRNMTERSALGVQEFVVDATETRVVSLLDALPQLLRILFAERHDCLPGPIPEVVSLEERDWLARSLQQSRQGLTNLLYVVDEQIVDVLLLGVELHQLVFGII
jgi:hypothetical protein